MRATASAPGGYAGATAINVETYAVSDFVSLVNQFMEQLGIVHAPLVGHSMGGTVSLSVAINYPDRVSKVVVVGSPMVGSSLTPLLPLYNTEALGSNHSRFTLV